MANETKNQRMNFLLTFFDKEEKYQEKEINGFWLVKQYNGNNKSWQVAIFTQENFKNMKNAGLFN